MSKIFLLEDDESLGSSLTTFLENQSYQVKWLKSISEFKGFYRDYAQTQDDLFIFDWMLSDGQGIDLLKDLRGQGFSAPVIMLSARAELIDKVIGLEAGLDDYMTKPFEARELLARIRVQLRKGAQAKVSSAEELKHKNIKFDLNSRQVFYAEQEVELTKMEFELLKLFVENPGRAFSREEILNKVWGYENYPTTRTVDTHMLQLRNKTDEAYFETIRGVGYRLIP